MARARGKTQTAAALQDHRDLQDSPLAPGQLVQVSEALWAAVVCRVWANGGAQGLFPEVSSIWCQQRGLSSGLFALVSQLYLHCVRLCSQRELLPDQRWQRELMMRGLRHHADLCQLYSMLQLAWQGSPALCPA